MIHRILAMVGTLMFLVAISNGRLPAQSAEDHQAVSTQANDQALARYFALETAKLSDACLADIKTLDDWKQQQPKLRQQLFEMLGLHPLPKKNDLQVKVTGETEHDEFRVKRLHFQSLPNLYVTGNLYLPEESDGKSLPAVLYVCGHGKVKINGESYGNKVHYHHHGSWFARHGYVCLTIDTLQLGEIEGIHHGTYREKMWWWLNRGYTPAGVEAWNCIRAIDLLQSLPEVDTNRIGVTGRSGGGAYSWWIAALDERIRCAVPVAGITDLQNHVVDGCVEGHCDCMFMVNTFRWDYPLVAAPVAPRPLLISNTDRDRIFPLDGVYRTYEKVKKIYALHGAADKVALHITAGPHQDTQELRIHAFRWLNHHLKQDDSLIRQPAEKVFEPAQLKVFSQLPNDQLNAVIHESFVPASEPAIPPDDAEWAAKSASWKQQLKEKTFGGWPRKPGPLQLEKKQLKVDDGQALTSGLLEFQSQPHVRLRILHFGRANPKPGVRARLFLLDDTTWNAVEQSSKSGWKSIPASIQRQLDWVRGKPVPSLAAFVNDDDSTLYFFSPRGMGPHTWNPAERFQTQTRRRFYLLGQTADGMRNFDVVRAAGAIRKSMQGKTKDDRGLTVHAGGRLAGVALYAEIMGNSIQELWLDQPVSTHRNGPWLLNVRKLFDIPQAVAMAAETAKINIVTNEPGRFYWPLELEKRLKRAPKVSIVERDE